MLMTPADYEELYDGTGRHLAGIHPPIMVNSVLTPVYAAKTAARPASRHVCGPAGPAPTLGLVWMMPVAPNPLALSPQTLARIVHTLDHGQSVMLHADTQEALDTVGHWIGLMLGGGHA